ncbi:MAG: DEAD/DEAH box helicase [Prevotella sp.]|jgi:superfamily II DNA/RNA helicase
MNNEVLKKLNIQLNDIQLAADKAINSTDKDVVILSPTGTGKTLAYLLPLTEHLSQNDDLQAIVLVPGRELALQSLNVWKNMGSGFRAAACYGGRPTMDEHRELRKLQPQLVFATPGRLRDHLEKGNLTTDHVRWLVIDEFDKCLEMGFTKEMEDIMAMMPQRIRHILLSATDMEQIPHFVNMHSVERLDFLDRSEEVAERVSNFIVKSPTKDKLETLARLLCYLGDDSSIVFLNYRDAVERTTEYLMEQGFSVIGYHGGMDQREREEALYKFANHSIVTLVSTDLGSRGLDLPDVKNIIHYHLPEGQDEMIHRIGRTARWDAEGRTFFVLGPEEELPEYFTGETDNLELPAKLPLPALPKMTTLYIGKGKKNKISKGDIVGFFCKTCDLEFSDLGRIDVYDRYSYVAVKREKSKKIIELTKNAKIKGIHTKVEKVR